MSISRKKTLKEALREKSFWNAYIILCLLALFSLFYYFGELVDVMGWTSLQGIFLFYTVHDIHRFLFLLPIIYAGYALRVKGAIIISVVSYLIFLPRALFVSDYPDPFLRMTIYTVCAGIMGILVGVTRNSIERMNIGEQIIRRERDMLYGILQRMKDGVMIVGSDYRVQYLNPAMISEFGHGIGARCYEYLHGFDRPCSEICHLRDILGGKTERWEENFPEGGTYEIIGSPFVDQDDTVSQLAIYRNITKRKQAELELIKLNELKSDLLSNVSHELRSPLTSVKGIISSLLQKDIEWDEETKLMLLNGISEETDRLSSLVTNLLNMSKLESGVWQPEREYRHISDIVTDALEHEKWINKNHIFIGDIKTDLPEVYIDSNQIRQVLNNLLENAAAYSKENTEIIISAELVDGGVQVGVSDKGIGISSEEMAKIFDKFYRGSQGRQKPGGIGLGLSICQAIILAHGGSIRVESEIGKGTTFYFTLPNIKPDGNDESE